MKTLLFSTLAALLLYVGFKSPSKFEGGNPPSSENRNLSGFTIINAAFNGEIELTQADEDKVTVIADPAKMASITTRVEDGVLYISSREAYNKNCKSDETPMKVQVSIRNLKEITNTSNGSFISTNTIKGDVLEINNAANGKMELNLNYTTFNCNTSANGRMILKGKIQQAEINNVMNGSLDAEGLIVENMVLNNTANGRANVYANQSLEINQAGNGSVSYSGNANPEINNSGHGAVSKKK